MEFDAEIIKAVLTKNLIYAGAFKRQIMIQRTLMGTESCDSLRLADVNMLWSLIIKETFGSVWRHQYCVQESTVPGLVVR